MYLKQFLTNAEFQKVNNNDNSILLDCSKDETEVLRIFIDSLLDEDNCQVIFRGENSKKAFNRSGADRCGKSFKKRLARHSDIIFYIGEKSSSYLYSKYSERIPHDINAVDNNVFIRIFNELSNISNKFTQAESSKLDERFCKYFLETSKEKFIEKISKLETSEKEQIKFYYFWLLHTLDESPYKSVSNFLSTSKDYRVAINFAKEEIVYCGWIPRPIKNRAVYLGSIIQLKQRLKKYDLPVYNNEPYPEEREISLVGGLFPHYTFGIYNIKNKKFIINKYIFNEYSFNLIKSGMSEIIINSGIQIDQSNFRNSLELRNSKYFRWLTYASDIGFYDNDI